MLAVTAFTAVVLINIVQITLRYGFDSSIFWVQEISQLLMLLAYFVGASCVFRARHYVIVELLVERLAPRRQLHVYALAQALTALFCVVVLAEALAELPRLMTAYTVILHLPKAYAHLPLVIASASMVLTTLYYGLAVWSLAVRSPGRSVAELEARVHLGRGPR
jgi:TRAP-type C4-dicarboxylate transport system permease small subunit